MFPNQSTEALKAKLINRAYGEWLQRFSWDHYLTVGAQLSSEVMLHRFKRGIRALESFWGHRVDWVASLEHGSIGALPHIHALVAQTARHRTSELLYPWRFIHNHARIYDSGLGATFYLSKGVFAESSELFLSKRTPPNRSIPDWRGEHACEVSVENEAISS